jgi:maltose/moltooligosaccharide transporter
VIASALPWILTNFVHLKPEAAGAHAIPLAVRLSFYIGALAFLSAVLWTICTTREYPPEDMEAFRKAKATRRGFGQTLREVASAISQMPRTMRQLAPVQLLTWLGLFCMWLYFPVAVARNAFGAASEKVPEYAAGVEWAGICFGFYSAVCFVFSFFLPALAKAVGRKTAHSLCLAAGAVGLLSVGVIHNQYVLLLSMLGVGIAWASILSMPYSILAASIPAGRTGVYMGIFNFFIVTPEILASLFFGWFMNHVLHNNRMAAVIAGGVFLAIAALLTLRVTDVASDSRQQASAATVGASA